MRPAGRHALSETLLIAFAVALCGPESCAELAECAAAKQVVLRQALSASTAEHFQSRYVQSGVSFARHRSACAAFAKVMAAFTPSLGGLLANTGKIFPGDGKSWLGAFERCI